MKDGIPASAAAKEAVRREKRPSSESGWRTEWNHLPKSPCHAHTIHSLRSVTPSFSDGNLRHSVRLGSHTEFEWVFRRQKIPKLRTRATRLTRIGEMVVIPWEQKMHCIKPRFRLCARHSASSPQPLEAVSSRDAVAFVRSPTRRTIQLEDFGLRRKKMKVTIQCVL